MTDQRSADDLAGYLGAGRDWALFLDFDGTLVDIAARPEAVVVVPGLPECLTRLRHGLDGALAVVTGRPIAAIDGFLAPLRIDVAGLHGVELRLGDELAPCRPDEHPDLRRAVEGVIARLGHEPGLVIEDKGCSLAVHWRLADADRAALAQRTIVAAAASLDPAYRLQRGKAVAEIVPARASKGAVIEDMLERSPYRGRRPVFIGDDVTDEHGFEAVNAKGGLAIKIGEGATEARFRLQSPDALRELLRLWADRVAAPAPRG